MKSVVALEIAVPQEELAELFADPSKNPQWMHELERLTAGRKAHRRRGLDVHHAWLLEDLPGGRLRILTQETQIGKPAQELARTKPNPMLNAHQEWIEGLARAAAQRAKS